MRAVIFDLDGTLLDTLDDLADAGNRVLAASGFPVHPVPKYRYFVGDGLTKLIERILPEEFRDREHIEQLILDFREDYGRNWRVKTGPYDGIREMLAALHERGLSLNILSNKPHDFTGYCVGQFFDASIFDHVLGLRPGAKRKPDPSGALEIAEKLNLQPGQVVYLGDTATDMMTAAAAGMYPVGALWGFRTAAELKESGARSLIAHPSELPAIIGLADLRR